MFLRPLITRRWGPRKIHVHLSNCEPMLKVGTTSTFKKKFKTLDRARHPRTSLHAAMISPSSLAASRPLHAPRGSHSRAPRLLLAARFATTTICRTAARHHRDRPAERLRPHPRGDPVQGSGADADRALLVRGDDGYLPEPRDRLSRPECARRARRLDILPVEIVVRDYLAGTTGTSILHDVQVRASARCMASVFPDGLRDNQKLPADDHHADDQGPHGGHDEPLSARRYPGAQGLLTDDAVARRSSDYALALFARGARARGASGA